MVAYLDPFRKSNGSIALVSSQVADYPALCLEETPIPTSRKLELHDYGRLDLEVYFNIVICPSLSLANEIVLKYISHFP